ncbi:MAG: segregation/condensation protein A, partial [Spirochaetales bacterium]|nr:segregation/condensation protein A [Spirochaetales bacterium]
MDESDKIKFKLGKFEGPLDLLLFLIKKAEVNIYDIPISHITKQYLDYLSYATKIDLENITEFYIMATTLLYIKSRMLLPVETNLDEEIEDPRQELVERLIEYQKFKKLTGKISDKETEWLIERKRPQMILPFAEKDFWEQAQIWDLLKIFSDMVSTLTTERIVDLYEEVTVNEKITLIRELIDTHGELQFTDLIKKGKSVSEIICAFLAVLELAKLRQIVVYQNKLFGDIRIKQNVSVYTENNDKEEEIEQDKEEEIEQDKEEEIEQDKEEE